MARLRPRKLSAVRAARLRPVLDGFARACDAAARLRFDPVELPHRYADPGDVEVAALISASLAYGRADLFKPQLEGVLAAMGPRPSRFAAELARAPSAEPFARFHYRFNRPADVAALVAAIGHVRAEQGSLGDRFAALYELECSALSRSARRPAEPASSEEGALRPALRRFAAELRDAPPAKALLRERGHRGLLHLCPDPGLSGACKRWNLYLRWMVRGPDAVDFGLWRGVPKSALVIPLDTHVARIARYLGLTDRRDMTWRTAQEITANLSALDPADPVRYDFALCHLGMSGACPPRRHAAKCAACALLAECRAHPKGLQPALVSLSAAPARP